MARTVMVPAARGEGVVYVEQGSGRAVLFAPGMYLQPVVHDRATGDRWDVTRCGRRVVLPDLSRLAPSVVLLRLDHALAFGRPCRRCWP